MRRSRLGLLLMASILRLPRKISTYVEVQHHHHIRKGNRSCEVYAKMSDEGSLLLLITY